MQSHPGLLSSLGDTLDQLTWFLPQRFSGSEVLSESLHSLLGLISLLHEWFVDAGGKDAAGRGRGVPWPLLLGVVRRVRRGGAPTMGRFASHISYEFVERFAVEGFGWRCGCVLG